MVWAWEVVDDGGRFPPASRGLYAEMSDIRVIRLLSRGWGFFMSIKAAPTSTSKKAPPIATLRAENCDWVALAVSSAAGAALMPVNREHRSSAGGQVLGAIHANAAAFAAGSSHVHGLAAVRPVAVTCVIVGGEKHDQVANGGGATMGSCRLPPLAGTV